jgi:hypothetical protein
LLKARASLIQLVLINQEATPSNCGKSLKLLILTCPGNRAAAKNNKLGHSKKSKDVTMGNPQPSPKAQAMDAVQRLNVGGQKRKLMHKIKSGPVENTAPKRNSQMLYPNAKESFEEV